MARFRTACALVLLTTASVALADLAKPAAGDSFQIESIAKPGMLLRVEDANSRNGTPIVLYPNQAWKCMTWQLQTDGEGFRLRNHFTNKTFGPTTKPSEDAATPLAQKPLAKDPTPDEALKFVPIDGQAGVYHIIHVLSGLTVEAGEDGNVVLKKASDADGQKFRLLDKPAHFTG